MLWRPIRVLPTCLTGSISRAFVSRVPTCLTNVAALTNVLLNKALTSEKEKKKRCVRRKHPL
jgi:hypothetical protein